jgi:hypothetical protein
MNKKYKRTAKKKIEILIVVASLPFKQSTSYKISRLVGKCILKTVQIPVKKSSHKIRSTKDG